jgi:outer membrane protein OmpA-like peptidoglycan-associated protein
VFRPTLLAFVTSSALLFGGCTALPGPTAEIGATATTATTAPDEQTGFDWLRERTQIGAALAETHDIEVQAMDDGALLIRLPAAEGFMPDSAAPTAVLRLMLDRVAAVLTDIPETEVMVLGHTDSIGSELYNLQLSIRRAEAVMEHLRSRGIALARLSADGRGEAEPIADNASEQGRAINRRVEVIVRPLH